MQGPQQLVACRVAGGEYAFRIDAVREIIRDGGAIQVGASDAVMLGVVDLRGTAMPVLDLAAMLGLSAASVDEALAAGSGGRRIVVTTHGDGEAIGWLVDGVDEVITVPGESVEALERAASELVRHVARVEQGRLLPVLDHERLREAIGRVELAA